MARLLAPSTLRFYDWLRRKELGELRKPGRKKVFSEEEMKERRKHQQVACAKREYAALRAAGFPPCIAKTRRMRLLKTIGAGVTTENADLDSSNSSSALSQGSWGGLAEVQLA